MIENKFNNLKNGDIVRNKDSGKIYVIDDSRKRWILTLDAASQFSLDLGSFVEFSDEEIRKIPVGGTVTDYPKELEKCKTSAAARAYLAKDLKGTGIECGPGTDETCYPLPLQTHVKYLDRFDRNEGCNQDYQGEYPLIDYKGTINNMGIIDDESLDFIVHCHVIEHSRNPIGAMKEAYKKLKPGGKLIMAVPDKNVTFDKPRALTTAGHMLLDYYLGIKNKRDLKHVHCCKKIWVGSGYKMIWDMTDKEILNYLEQDIIDIHWHTFTSDSFKLLLHKSRHIVPWKEINVISRESFELPDAFIEFYVILEK